MLETHAISPIEPEPEPSRPTPNPNLRLLPSIELREDELPAKPVELAREESVVAIVKSIKALVFEENKKDTFVFCRRKTVTSPLGGTVNLCEYGNFDPSERDDTPAKLLYKQERELLVAGMEIHYPTTATEEGEVEFPVDAYLIEKTTDNGYTFNKLLDDGSTGSALKNAVSEKDAIELLGLLQILLSNE